MPVEPVLILVLKSTYKIFLHVTSTVNCEMKYYYVQEVVRGRKKEKQVSEQVLV